MRAEELAHDLRHGDDVETYIGLAHEYLAIRDGATFRALTHARSGDLFVAYDEANDARIAIEMAAVIVTAMLAALAKQADYERRMRLDCGATGGDQLDLGPFPCPGCHAFPGEAHPPYCPDAAMAREDAQGGE